MTSLNWRMLPKPAAKAISPSLQSVWSMSALAVWALRVRLTW